MLLRIVKDVRNTSLTSENPGPTDGFPGFSDSGKDFQDLAFSASSTYCASRFTVPSIPSLAELMERS